MNITDKKIGLLGFGIENQALFQWLINHGAKNITICDKNSKLKTQNLKPQLKSKNFKYRLGKDYLKNLDYFDVVFRTPGISPLTPELVDAKKKGVEISSQIKLFMDLCSAKTVGITGTKGKGTTSTLIFEILKNSISGKLQKDVRFLHGAQASGKRLRPTFFNLPSNIYLGGNIGTPPIEFLDKLTRDDWVVLELSSFQLMDLTKSPNIAVVLDVKIDHLDYHKSRKEYTKAKENIVRYQTKKDFTVINLDSLTSYQFAASSPTENDYYFSRRKSVDLGCFVKWLPKGKGAHFGEIILRTPKKDIEICKTYDVMLRGEHNLDNITAAISASYLAGATIKSIKESIYKFKGLEHRLEYLGQNNGVKYYNDSFSTTPETAIAAIKSFNEPIILITGGSEKGANYKKFAKEILKSSVKVVVTIGKTGPIIAREINKTRTKEQRFPKIIPGGKNMKEIIKKCVKDAASGDVVLLSPASASFGMFKNYKDRGKQFKEEINKL